MPDSAKVKPRIFIGSSSENLELAIACQTNLQPYAEVTVWSQGVFEPSSTSLQSLENELEKSDFGLFYFRLTILYLFGRKKINPYEIT